MKIPFKRSLCLFIALSFFYSTMGHAFVLHYCSTETACVEMDCCDSDNDINCGAGSDNSISESSCCFETTQYLVNPFSVRQPSFSEIKKNDVVSESTILPAFSVAAIKKSYCIPVVFRQNFQHKDFQTLFNQLLI